ncbi:Uncharacterised protein [Nocardia africana]|uniref:Uncharacterized protein n=1 Tax=Nocardia africana TaxID=134964 RepID=A0A378X3C0_9NOCA|nr:Uncharacterised protein [Nocardia africana]
MPTGTDRCKHALDGTVIGMRVFADGARGGSRTPGSQQKSALVRSLIDPTLPKWQRRPFHCDAERPLKAVPA